MTSLSEWLTGVGHEAQRATTTHLDDTPANAATAYLTESAVTDADGEACVFGINSLVVATVAVASGLLDVRAELARVADALEWANNNPHSR